MAFCHVRASGSRVASFAGFHRPVEAASISVRFRTCKAARDALSFARCRVFHIQLKCPLRAAKRNRVLISPAPTTCGIACAPSSTGPTLLS
jgi:hypothetical protein